MMTKEEKIQLIAMLKEKMVRESRENLLKFTLSTMPTFDPVQFHKQYYEYLTKFAMGDIKKLAVFVPPQHGKSEGSTRRLPAFILGRDPDTKVAIVSYSAPKARKFNREIQRVIDTEEYREIFPETRLNGKNAKDSGTWLRNADECEIVGHRGGFKTVGVGGALTGEPVDVLIMDDLYKDARTAWSPAVRESVADWYDTVAETRLHNGSRQLIVFTRWHEDDLGGQLLRDQGIYDPVENPAGWVVCSFPAIKIGPPTDYDPRMEGEALWPERHSLEKLKEIRDRNPHVFESLYQQDPKPMEGLMYDHEFICYEQIPITRSRKIRAYIDTADTGADYLCCIIYAENDIADYILDVYYTQKPMEVTEVETAKRLTKYLVDDCIIESNNGGRGFARNVERNIREMGNTHTRIHWFTQTNNKDVRIFSHSADVMNVCQFPPGWHRLWPEFHKAVTGYMKEGKNEHDDAVDALTGVFEMRPSANKKSAANYF